MLATEAEEAKWWFDHRDAHAGKTLMAVNTGEATILTKQKLFKRIATSKKPLSPAQPDSRG